MSYQVVSCGAEYAIELSKMLNTYFHYSPTPTFGYPLIDTLVNFVPRFGIEEIWYAAIEKFEDLTELINTHHPHVNLTSELRMCNFLAAFTEEAINAMYVLSYQETGIRFDSFLQFYELFVEYGSYSAYTATHAVQLFNELVLFLYEYRRDDSGRVASLLRVFGTVERVRKALFMEVDPSCLQYLLKSSENERFDLWSLRCPRTTFHPLVEHLRGPPLLSNKERATDTLDLLIRYGFPYTMDLQYMRKMYVELRNLSFEGKNIFRNPNFACLPDRLVLDRIRRQMAMELFLAFCKQDGKTMDLLTILWRSIPDPTITMDEMNKLLCVFVEYEDRQVLYNACKQFSKASIFEVGTPQPGPRSLQHLCRVTIRKQLIQNNQLLNGIRKLNLATPIVNFLELDR